MSRKEMVIEDTYDYTDEAGTLLYQVVRVQGKTFPCRRIDDNGEWKWNLEGVKRVLYRLPDLLKRQDETVYIVEGEKDADRLHREGILSTTNPHGPGKWRKEYSEALKGRDVVIIPDNDEPGRCHAEGVAKSLAKKAHSIKLIELPDIQENGDVSDWLDARNGIDQLKSIVESTELWIATDEQGQSKTDGISEEPSQTELLIQMILASDITLFKDQRGQPYAWIRLEKGKTCIPVRSRDFTDWIAGTAWREMGWAIGSESLEIVKRTLACTAKFGILQHPLSVRVARHDDSIWVDLDGFKAVRVCTDGWEVNENPPILFRAYAHQRPLPIPERNGDWGLIHKYVNLNSEADLILFDTFILCGFIPAIQIPISLLYGPPHSGKSSIHKVIRRVLDPCHPEFQGKLRNMKDFAQVASQHRVLIYDNMSTLTVEQSVLLCGAVTGDGSEKRGLYTDEDTITFEYQNVICMNGVEMVASQSDLIDRSISQQLKQIPEKDQKHVSQLERDFFDDLPLILGGIFDVLSVVLRTSGSISLEWKTRFGDFVRCGVAAVEALGKSRDDFITAYRNNVERRYQDVIDGSPVALALVEFMKDKTDWKGRATELLQLLKAVAGSLGLETRAACWPQQPNHLSGQLSYLEEGLDHAGISVERSHSNGNRVLIITKGTSEMTMESAMNDDQNGSIVTSKPALQKRLDDGDDQDDDLTEIPREADIRDRRTWPEAWTEYFETRLAFLTEIEGHPENIAQDLAMESLMTWSTIQTYGCSIS